MNFHLPCHWLITKSPGVGRYEMVEWNDEKVMVNQWLRERYGELSASWRIETTGKGRRSASSRCANRTRKMPVCWLPVPPRSLPLPFSLVLSRSLSSHLSFSPLWHPFPVPFHRAIESRRTTGIPLRTRNATRTRGRRDGEPIERRGRTLNEGQSDRERKMRAAGRIAWSIIDEINWKNYSIISRRLRVHFNVCFN